METNKKISVLNLFAGLGGNRKNWENVDVTAVENNSEIAAIYQDFFPNDKVIVGDAHEYLLKHFKEYDFVWSSPPCQSHSRIRNEAGVGRGQNKPIYPDMKLYEEIILLRHLAKLKKNGFTGKYLVENVIPYYEAMFNPQVIGQHCFWANFLIRPFYFRTRNHWNKSALKKTKFNINNLQWLRNCTEPELGKHIFDCAFNGKAQTLFTSPEMIQDNLFAEVDDEQPSQQSTE